MPSGKFKNLHLFDRKTINSIMTKDTTIPNKQKLCEIMRTEFYENGPWRPRHVSIMKPGSNIPTLIRRGYYLPIESFEILNLAMICSWGKDPTKVLKDTMDPTEHYQISFHHWQIYFSTFDPPEGAELVLEDKSEGDSE